MINKISALTLAFSLLSTPMVSANYCDSPDWSAVAGVSLQELRSSAATKGAKSVECGVIHMARAVDEQHVGARWYVGKVVIANADDTHFKAASHVSGFTVFSYWFNSRQLLQFAYKGTDWQRGDELQAGAYYVSGTQQFISAAGVPIEMLVLNWIDL